MTGPDENFAGGLKGFAFCLEVHFFGIFEKQILKYQICSYFCLEVFGGFWFLGVGPFLEHDMARLVMGAGGGSRSLG